MLPATEFTQAPVSYILISLFEVYIYFRKGHVIDSKLE